MLAIPRQVGGTGVELSLATTGAQHVPGELPVAKLLPQALNSRAYDERSESGRTSSVFYLYRPYRRLTDMRERRTSYRSELIFRPCFFQLHYCTSYSICTLLLFWSFDPFFVLPRIKPEVPRIVCVRSLPCPGLPCQALCRVHSTFEIWRKPGVISCVVLILRFLRTAKY